MPLWINFDHYRKNVTSHTTRNEKINTDTTLTNDAIDKNEYALMVPQVWHEECLYLLTITLYTTMTTPVDYWTLILHRWTFMTEFWQNHYDNFPAMTLTDHGTNITPEILFKKLRYHYSTVYCQLWTHHCIIIFQALKLKCGLCD